MKQKSTCGKIPIIEHNKKVLKKAFYPPGW